MSCSMSSGVAYSSSSSLVGIVPVSSGDPNTFQVMPDGVTLFNGTPTPRAVELARDANVAAQAAAPAQLEQFVVLTCGVNASGKNESAFISLALDPTETKAGDSINLSKYRLIPSGESLRRENLARYGFVFPDNTVLHHGHPLILRGTRSKDGSASSTKISNWYHHDRRIELLNPAHEASYKGLRVVSACQFTHDVSSLHGAGGEAVTWIMGILIGVFLGWVFLGASAGPTPHISPVSSININQPLIEGQTVLADSSYWTKQHTPEVVISAGELHLRLPSNKPGGAGV